MCLVASISAGRPRGGTLNWDLRDQCLIGAIAAALWALLGAEVLSTFHGFSRVPVTVWWIVPVTVLATRVWPRRSDGPRPLSGPDRDPLNLALLAIAAVILLFTCLMAFFTPPTTPDSLCYHLPRQVYWIENHTVAHYPAYDRRQLEMPPLAEYIGAQLMLLSGTDHQANLVQWFAYLLSALAASAIARDLGAGARGQSFAALLALLNPAAATQAENAKNDIVVALWTLALIWSAVRVWILREFGIRQAALVGLALGLLFLTKGTAYTVAPPVCAVTAFGALRAAGRRAIPLVAVIVFIVAAVNGPHWARNVADFGSPLGLPASKGGYDLGNTTHSPKAIASNLLRNLTAHTNAKSRRFDAWQQQTVEWLHRRLGIDPSDPRTTSPPTFRYEVLPSWNSDGNNGAPVHLVLAVAMAFAIRPRSLVSRPVWPAFFIPYACAILFAFLLKWQPWHARLHIPIVATAAPVIAVWLQRRPVIISLATVAAAYLAIAAVLWNEFKPILGPRSVLGKTRDQVLFETLPAAIPDPKDAAEVLETIGPKTVGIDYEPYYCEYAAMRRILELVHPQPHLSVLQPITGSKPPPNEPPPDAALVLSYNKARPILHTASNTAMVKVFESGAFQVCIRGKRLEAVRLAHPVPAFFGWDSDDGLKAAEGPYPQFDLPIVRWAQKRTMTLAFRTDGAPMTLVMECRRNDTTSQTMTVRFDGSQVLHFEFGGAWEFRPLQAALNAAAGEHELTFDFANVNEPGSAWAVLFRKLQIVPTAWVQQSPADEHGNPSP
jgi:4-amino-4-deoxy-L-arabinose transferase-like glycosyltransferase